MKNKTLSFVTESAAMVAPTENQALAHRDYVVRNDAPATHARLGGNPKAGLYTMTFNGVDVVTFEFEKDADPSLRRVSDGDFQSAPFVQQFTMQSKEPAHVRIHFRAPVEMWNIRPNRAQKGQTILGQSGRPLLYGVNGMYLPDWDLLLSWHGYEFSWNDVRVNSDEHCYSASMDITLTTKPFVLLFRPHYYREHLGYQQYKPWEFRPNPKAITGWCSWEAYHSEITQANLEQDAQSLKDLKNYGLEYMQLDDGYQQTTVPPAVNKNIPDGWLNTNEKFPDGHAGIVNAIHAGGFEAGIWTNCVANNP